VGARHTLLYSRRTLPARGGPQSIGNNPRAYRLRRCNQIGNVIINVILT
jgi:hypothetical protein